MVTGVLAIYGAGLATFLGYREIRRERRSVVVFCRPVLEPSPSGRGMEGYIGVRAVNVGHRPVEIIEAWFHWDQMSGQVTSVTSPRWPQLPRVLGDGESITVRYDEESFGRLIESNGMPHSVRVVDSLDNEYSTAVPDSVREVAAEALERAREFERENDPDAFEEDE